MSYLDRLGGKTWIAAHRGIAGGDIPCNSESAYKAALCEGADIVELDISVSLDGTCYLFHPKKESLFLKSDRLISEMHDDEIDKLRLLNSDGAFSFCGVPKFADIMMLLKDKCVLNVDKFWTDVPRISECIRKCGMQDQVIVKAPLNEKSIKELETYAWDLPFMPMIKSDDGQHEALLANKKIRYIGAEVLFSDENSVFCSDAFIDKMHKDGCAIWVNPIIYDPRTQLVAGHSDDVSMTGDPDAGWGWLINKGFDILQTDWPMMLRLYGSKKFPDRIVNKPAFA